jgi:hypothetical protein
MMQPGIFLLVFTAAFCRVVEGTPSIPPASVPLPDPHEHVMDVDQTAPSPEIIADFMIVEVTLDHSLERENAVESPGGTFLAFTVCDPALCSGDSCCRERILFENIQSGGICEIQGLPLPWRPFSDLVWITDSILVFDRWSGPDHGVHYAVDVLGNRLLLASPFPGRLPAAP